MPPCKEASIFGQTYNPWPSRGALHTAMDGMMGFWGMMCLIVLVLPLMSLVDGIFGHRS